MPNVFSKHHLTIKYNMPSHFRKYRHRPTCIGFTHAYLRLLIFMSCLIPINALSGETASDDLSVEATVGLMLSGYFYGSNWNYYKHSNVKAKPMVYKILENKGAEAYHANTLTVLGYIGDDKDVKYITNMAINGFSGVLDEVKKANLRACFGCLGLMRRRGIKTADNEINNMVKPDYWKGVKFRWRPENIKVAPGFDYETIMFVMHSCASTGNHDLENLINNILNDIKDEDIKRIMKAYLSPNTLNGAAERMIAEEGKPITDEERKIMMKSYTDNMSIVGDNKGFGEKEDAFVKNCMAESIKSYEDIRKSVLNGENESLSGCLLEKGKPIEEEHLKRTLADYKKALEKEKQIFEAMSDRKITNIDFIVDRRLEYKFQYEPKKELLYNQIKEETITVTFKLMGAADIGNVILPRQRGIADIKGSYMTVASDGTLIVVMKKIKDKWYWNPFGW